jgi:hypothetical protein
MPTVEQQLRVKAHNSHTLFESDDNTFQLRRWYAVIQKFVWVDALCCRPVTSKPCISEPEDSADKLLLYKCLKFLNWSEIAVKLTIRKLIPCLTQNPKADLCKFSTLESSQETVQKTNKNYTVRRFVICILHEILLEWSKQEGWYNYNLLPHCFLRACLQ